MLLGAMAKITVPPPCDHPIVRDWSGGIQRLPRPGPDAPFAIRGDVARAETIGKQHNVPMRGQGCAQAAPPRHKRAPSDLRRAPDDAKLPLGAG